MESEAYARKLLGTPERERMLIHISKALGGEVPGWGRGWRRVPDDHLSFKIRDAVEASIVGAALLVSVTTSARPQPPLMDPWMALPGDTAAAVYMSQPNLGRAVDGGWSRFASASAATSVGHGLAS